MTNFFKYSSLSYNNLYENSRHMFARNHAVCIYNSDAIYSLIPKNGCSTLRTTIAYANGCIENKNDFQWIHTNTYTFAATMPELVKAKYTFTILRCPFSRVASAFLDKIVSKDVVAWELIDLLDRKIDIDQITFAKFVKSLKIPSVLQGNIHWRPQVDFLVYKSYDDYFSFHDFDEIVKTLSEKISLEVIDARELTSHGTEAFTIIKNESFSHTLPREIFEMKRNGSCPSLASLYNDELIDIVSKIYHKDINLYREVIGNKGLMIS